MSRFYNFIQGDEPELDWSPVIDFLPKEFKKKSSKTSYDALLNLKTSQPFASERVVFISDHGNSCRLFSDPGQQLLEIVELIVDQLPAKKILLHFSGCELLSPQCTNISELIGVDSRICAVSGYGSRISFKDAAKIDAALLKCLYQMDELSFENLLFLKRELFRSLPDRLERLDFHFNLN